MKTYHFFYSRAFEISDLFAICVELTWSCNTPLFIPNDNRVRLPIEGEEVEVHYNLCAESMDAYPQFPDLVYLGTTTNDKIVYGRLDTISKIRKRVEELGLPVPAILNR